MKILILGSAAKGALEHFYVKGLVMEGNAVDLIDISSRYYSSVGASLQSKVINKLYPDIYYRPINEALLDDLAGKVYDVILVFKGLVLFPATVKNLKQYCHLLACYNPDHPFDFYSPGSGNANIRNSVSAYDLYLTYSQKIKDRLLKENIAAEVIPFGYDDYNAISNDTSSMYSKWLFIGSFDNERAQELKKLHSSNLWIFGDQKWRTRSHSSYLKTCYQNRGLFDEEYIQAMRNSWGVINLLRKQNLNEGSHNMRTFEVPGCGGALIAQRTEEQEEFYTDGVEAIFFDSMEELVDKLVFYERHLNKLEEIKFKGLERSIQSQYGYSYRSRQMSAVFRKFLSWKN